MADAVRMTDDLRCRKFLEQRSGAAGMVDMDVGEQDVVEPLYPAPLQFGNETRH